MFSLKEFIGLLSQAKILGADSFDYSHYEAASKGTLYCVRFWGGDEKTMDNLLASGAGYDLKEPFAQALENLKLRRKHEDGT